MQQPWGAGVGFASGSSCCLLEPQALLNTSLCGTQPWSLRRRADDAGGQREEMCCLHRGREGGGGFYGRAWLKPRSEEEAQSFPPSFRCVLAAGIVHGAKGVVVWVWTGCAMVLLLKDGRVWVGWEGGTVEGWVCVLVEGLGLASVPGHLLFARLCLASARPRAWG